MEIDLMPMPSWALVSTNNGESENIPPLEPIKLHSVPQWGHTLMSQLRHTADEINSLHCQIQGDETEAYRIFMQMQTDYHKIETNLNLAIAQAQQHAADATGAHFNLTTTQFAEVAATHMALRRHVETITISTAENVECRQTLLRDFAQPMEANQNVWIAYHKDQAAKQEKFNSDCQQWASEMTAREAKASANQEKVKKDLQKLKRLQEQLQQDQVKASATSQQEREDMRKSFRQELQSIGEELKVQFQSAQQSRKNIDATSVINSVLEQGARWGRVPLPNDDEMESEYDLPPPPRSERSGRGSIPRGRTTESRDSSPPSGVVPPPRPPPGGSSSSSSSSDSESDGPKDLGKDISRLIRALRKKDKKNRITKRPEAIFLRKASKMKEPEVFDGDQENYIPWMKAVKEYMTVRSIDFNNNATRIHCLGSLLKGDARQWH
jgi:DNA polymerase III alpha subunit (gram-positive type)